MDGYANLQELRDDVRKVAVRLAARHLAEDPTPGGVRAMVHAVYGWADRCVTHSQGRPKWECGPGCWYCCSFAAVSVTAPEALVLAEDLRAHLTGRRLRTVEQRFARESPAGPVPGGPETPTPEARRVPCPLLDKNGRCSLYAFRPLRCRGCNSFNRSVCMQVYEQDETVETFPIDLVAHHAGIGVQEGLMAATHVADLPGGLYPLAEAVRVALATPEAASVWLAGDNLFAPCTRITSDA